MRNYRSYLQRATGVHTDMHQPAISVRGDTAWITYYWTDAGSVEGKRFTSRGKSTRIFVREGGRWLCIHGHYTAVPVRLYVAHRVAGGPADRRREYPEACST